MRCSLTSHAPTFLSDTILSLPAVEECGPGSTVRLADG